MAEFERAFAAALGQPEAIAVSSCTAGLHLVLHALGIGRGDEVVVPSLSFIATANAVAHTGATPVFADIELATYNLDPASAATAISRRTKAIVLVHQVGLPADVAAFRRLARKARVKLVEDAACAIGSQVDGRPVGRDAAVAVFSFHPRKLVTTGEGGMIVTRDRRLATRLRSLRHHGVSMSDFARHAAGRVVVEAYGEVGYNYRMTDVQAAIGLVQLARLEAFIAKRIEQGERYDRAFAKHPALAIPLPAAPAARRPGGSRHADAAAARAGDRDAARGDGRPPRARLPPAEAPRAAARHRRRRPDRDRPAALPRDDARRAGPRHRGGAGGRVIDEAPG